MYPHVIEREDNMKYVLLTAARNEEKYIGATIQSVIQQTIPPFKWIIVSDGSTDDTDLIVMSYAQTYKYINLIRRVSGQTNDFSSKVYALNTGIKELQDGSFSYLGILDADITFEPDYYEKITNKLQKNGKLGIAGGYIYERNGAEFKVRSTNSRDSVAGGIQMFRRECFETVKEFTPLRYGGEDSLSGMIAKYNGWHIRSFPELKVYHHKTGCEKRGLIKDYVRQGKMDFHLGYHPIFEFMKFIRRAFSEKPYIINSSFRLYGFCQSYFNKEQKLIDSNIEKYVRREQMNRIKSLIGISTLKRAANERDTYF